MPQVFEMTDTQVLDKVRREGIFDGFATDHMHELLLRALDLAPDDPIVLGRCLELWYYFSMPVPDGYSSKGPSRAEGLPLHRKALERA